MHRKKLLDVRLWTIGVAALVACLFSFPSAAFADDEKEDEATSLERSGERATAALASLQSYLQKGNYRAAFPLVRIMADKGYANYQVYLAKMYLNGQGTKRDSKKAAEWFTTAAQRGSKDAASHLGKMYFKGEGVPQDYKAARKWLEQGPADGEAAVCLGRIYSDGLGTDRDYNKAIDAFKLADSKGTDTKIIIGILYSLGGFGVEKNFTQAKKWLEMAANQKNALAQCALGFVYYEGGHGLAKNLDKAKQFILKSKPILEKKAATGNPAALTWLGRISYIGMFQNKDYARARKYFEASGDADSLHQLGMMAKKGQGGLRKDFKKAMELFRRADAAGSYPAKVSIGELYYLGQGVPKNLCEAKKWFEQGSKNEDAIARFYLGRMYANGECVKVDMQRARAYFQLAKPALELALATNEDCAGYLKTLNTDYPSLAAMPEVPQSTVPEPQTVSEVAKVPEVKQDAPVSQPPPKKPLDFKALTSELEALVLEFYPRAKIVKTDKSIHFEYKVKSLKLPSIIKQITVPESEGILGDLTVTPGVYAGTEMVPFQSNETYYVSLLMAPYSEPLDSHLLTKLLFPPSSPSEFVTRFKSIVNRFQ
jgi:TPR repeat protein